MIRRFLPALAVATLVVAGAACGGDDDAESPATTEATDDTTAATTIAGEDTSPDTTAADGEGGPDGCAWLSAEAATEALGAPMDLIGGGAGGCYFSPASGEGPAVQISVIQIAIDVDEYVEGSKALCESDVIEVDNGDAGWACLAAINPQGSAVFGRELVIADITDAASEDEGVQLAAAVAAEFTPS